MMQHTLAIWSLVPVPFLNTAWTSWSSRLTVEAWLGDFWTLFCYSVRWVQVWPFFGIAFLWGWRMKTDLFQSCGLLHGVLQGWILEWVALPFFRGSSQHKNRTQVSHTAGRFFTIWATREAQEYWSVAYPFSSRSSQPRNQTKVSFIAVGFFYQLSYQESLRPISSKNHITESYVSALLHMQSSFLCGNNTAVRVSWAWLPQTFKF